MEIRIIADSSADLLTLENVDFVSVPLKIITGEKEYVDDEKLNVNQMVEDLEKYSGKSSTSCPNSMEWLQAFGDSEQIICITITGTLSGSYNAACVAKNIYEEQNPSRKVFVLNSLSAGPELGLIIEKIQELILKEYSFDEICNIIIKYTEKTSLIFMLKSMKNLVNNGRVSPLVARMAGLLGIRVVGKASDIGDLEQMNKCRGEQNALKTILQN